MQKLTALVPLVLSAQTLSAEALQHDALANEIESEIELPAGSEPLSAYGRNYAFRSTDEVVALYLIPFMVFDGSQPCWNGAGESCSKERIERLKRDSDARQAGRAAPGKRRWFKNEDEFPDVIVGGCAQVNVRYNTVTKALSAFCNGPP